MSKLDNDQYYTNANLAQYCIDKAIDVLPEDISEIIEPSAGTGSFSKLINGCIAYDLYPKDKSIIEQDFTKLDLEYKPGRLIIGNPPFGDRGHLMQSFVKKGFEIADYIAFILPINQLNNTQSLYKFDLAHSEDLGICDYSGRAIHCCFNIYKRPAGGAYTKPINYADLCKDIIRCKEYRRSASLENKFLDPEPDLCILSWGRTLGKPVKPYELAKTTGIFIRDSENLEYYKKLIMEADWKKLYPSVSTPNLLMWQIYKFVYDNRVK